MRFYSLVEEKGASPYFGFSHVRMKDIHDIDEIRSYIPKMTIHYDWGEEIMIVKFMVGATHEVCGGMFRLYFEESIRAQTGDLLDSFIPLKSTRCIGSQRMKEGDEAYKPTSRDLESDWPSIVIEVGVFEGLTRLQQDARFWLEASGGQTRTVIIICVNCNNRNLVIQWWQDAPAAPAQNMHAQNPYNQNYVATQIQSLDLQEGQNYAGASLTIPASLAYDIVPLGLGPNDFEITAQKLNEFNIHYWRVLH